jgi:hypothetical protein
MLSDERIKEIANDFIGDGENTTNLPFRLKCAIKQALTEEQKTIRELEWLRDGLMHSIDAQHHKIKKLTDAHQKIADNAAVIGWRYAAQISNEVLLEVNE